ncbi:MAG TPA: aldo/keto reductase [Ramlibacter sp.]|nr:aldo/keto reductase [Ramlibacter sp.]
MEERNIGRSGLRASVVGLGCNNIGWTIDKEASRKVIDKAFELGVTFFDTAHAYGTPPGNSEEVLGELLQGRRNQAIVATKFVGTPSRRDSSRRHILDAIEQGLRRLKTDWIDVYMIHWPDLSTPMEETLRALDDIIRGGKARYIGCCNLSPWRVVEAKWISKVIGAHGFIAGQYEYNLLNREVEKELIPALQEYGIGLVPYFPLASGLLTGKYLDPAATGRLKDNWLNLGDKILTDSNLAKARKLDAFARDRGHTLLELAMSWLAQRPTVATIIAGATRPEQLEQNIKAVGWKLTAGELAELDTLLTEQHS